MKTAARAPLHRELGAMCETLPLVIFRKPWSRSVFPFFIMKLVPKHPPFPFCSHQTK